jgi:hypothetical protein
MRVEEERPTRADPSPPDPFLGQVLGGCRIDEVIGRGGMGVVYRATQLSLNRPVAIKVLPQEVCAEPQFVERFPHWTAGKVPGFVDKLSSDPAVVRWVAEELGVDPAVARQYRLVSWRDQIILLVPATGDPLNPSAEAAFRWLVLNAVGEVGGTVTVTKPVSGTEFRTSPPKGLATGGAD